MIRKILFLLILISPFAAYSQDSTRLTQLLQERKILYQDYVFLNAQNSNFWGKKSKNDLLKIIDTLKEIIRKDTEIIQAVNTESLRRQALVTAEKNKLQNQVVDDNRVVNNNLYELKSQLNSLQNLQKVKQKQLQLATEKVQSLQNSKQNSDLMVVLCVLIILGLLYYIFSLQRRLLRKKR